MGEHRRDRLQISFVVEDALLRPGVPGAAGGRRVDEAAAAVWPELAADDGPALVGVAPDVRDQFLQGVAAGMGVAGDGRAALPAEELVDRHPGLFALDVPEGDI